MSISSDDSSVPEVKISIVWSITAAPIENIHERAGALFFVWDHLPSCDILDVKHRQSKI
jgi:hypothetical protein